MHGSDRSTDRNRELTETGVFGPPPLDLKGPPGLPCSIQLDIDDMRFVERRNRDYSAKRAEADSIRTNSAEVSPQIKNKTC